MGFYLQEINKIAPKMLNYETNKKELEALMQDPIKKLFPDVENFVIDEIQGNPKE